MARHWRRLGGGLLAAALALAGCAHGPPPRALVEAREAYQQAASGPAAQERPQDVAQAWQALLEAEREYDRSHDSPRTRSLAYVALRRAQLAEVRAGLEVARRERELSRQSLREAQQARRQRAQDELQDAQRQLAEARRQREEAQRLVGQQEAGRLQAEAEAERQRAQQLRAQEESRRAQAEAQRLAAERESQAQAKARRLSTQREAEARAEAQRLATQLEAERQARLEAEQRAARALGELEGVQVREDARGTVLTLSGSILFASGRAELLPAARNRLEEVARTLERTDALITVEGHTDARGPEPLNEELSRQRAEAVRDFLVSRGVPPRRIQALGLGEYRPVASNATAEGRANNRRVEIILQRNVAAGPPGPSDTGGAGEPAPEAGPR